jgi:hypothetical protein
MAWRFRVLCWKWAINFVLFRLSLNSVYYTFESVSILNNIPCHRKVTFCNLESVRPQIAD